MSIIKSLANRRTYYNIDKNIPVLEKEIEEKIKEVTELGPGCIQYEKCESGTCLWRKA